MNSQYQNKMLLYEENNLNDINNLQYNHQNVMNNMYNNYGYLYQNNNNNNYNYSYFPNLYHF